MAYMAVPLKAFIKNSDMNEGMQKDCVHFTNQALQESDRENDICESIKRALDAKYKPNWQVFAGRNFGCFISHAVGTFIYFYINQMAVMIFKTT